MFKMMFSKLSGKKKEEVFDAQRHGHKWHNEHCLLKIFSTTCQKTVPDQTPNRPLPCSSCTSVLQSKAFKTLLRKPAPSAKNLIFTNKIYRNQILGEIYRRVVGLKNIIKDLNSKNKPCVRYANGVLAGRYNDQVFSGLLEAMVQKRNRKERGVGMQNFRYAPAWDEFAHILNIHSPRAYRALRKHFPAPAERTLRKCKAQQPRFPQQICDCTFRLVQDHLAEIDYKGLCSLSCDDTKLFAMYRLYWDGEQHAHMLVGGTDGPIKVLDPDDMKEILHSVKDKKAVKV
ncbi:hypothetical protein B0H34DRAFT_828006 [Crassisporium funariophilum]|nr:hypothetical protein B0H34DRAFT_828006 [Crassisporium funariophilum]